MEWKTVKLGDILNFRRGHDLPYSEMREGDIPVAGSNGCIGYHNVATPITPIITIGRSGNIGTPYYYEKAWAHNTTLYLDDFKGNNPKYLYYLLKTLPLAAFTGGSAVPTLNRNHIHPLEVLHVDDRATQDKIVAILSSLDDKIENNNRINRNLEEQAQALFKSWFVDFEPWGGTMPEDWKKGNLLDVADLFDHKRIPLSGMQRDRMEKIYPYYGATSVMDYVDNYLYDGIYLLMGEDGSVMTDEGFPFLQYVEGKFWCNNHAHIMQGKNGYTTEMLYCLLNRTNVSGIVTGAVQGKISQASMKKIPVVLPPAKVCADMSGKLAPYFDEIRSLRQESQRLAALRDTLLPKLMKGEIAL